MDSGGETKDLHAALIDDSKSNIIRQRLSLTESIW